MPSLAHLKSLRPVFAAAAQRVYDDWDEEDVDTYAGGGICHLIADAFCDVLNHEGFDCSSVSASMGEQHVWAVALVDEGVDEEGEPLGDSGVYLIDIPPSVYERGAGYSWTKKKDITFDLRDVCIEGCGDISDWEAIIND